MNTGKRNIFILILLAFFGAIGISLIRPILPIFARRMGATGFAVGGLTSGFMLARAIMAYVCGKYSDRIGQRKVFLPIGFFAYIVSCVFLFFSRSYADVLIISICQGAFSGMIWPMAQVVTIESSMQAFKTRALSFYFASGNSGMTIGNALLGGAIFFIMTLFGTGENDAFRIIFILSGAIYVICFFISFFISEVKTEKTIKQKPRKQKAVKDHSAFISLIVLGFLIGIIPGLVRSIMVLYLNEQFLVSTKNIAFILMTLSLAGFFSMLIFSYFSDKKGTLKVLIVVCFMTGFAALIIPMINNVWAVIVFLVIVGTGARSFTPISRSSMSEFGGGQLGQNIGLINTVSNLGSVVGPLAGGLLYDYFPKPFLFVNLNVSIFSFVGISILFSLVVMIRIYMKSKDHLSR
ncbi:MAG: MFS transporter [Candidatus Cloacimonadota bacterium]|nr:MAG: MFS transporter [Candidatus Cloacimonadota bacterium]